MKPINVLTAHVQAYQAKDIQGIDAMLADEVHLQDWSIHVRGKAAALEETHRNFGAAENLQLVVLRFYEAGAYAVAGVRIRVNDLIELDVVDVITITPPGKISSIRSYKG